MIQLPISILDSHIYSSLIKNGVDKEIVARSVFLQGVLFNRNNIHAEIKQAEDLLRSISVIDSLVRKYKTDLLTLACTFVSTLKEVNYMIVGTSCSKHLSNIVYASKSSLQSDLYTEIKVFSDQYKDWGNPRNWKC